MVNKGSSFADFMRFHPHTYACIEQYLPPLWAAIMTQDQTYCFNYLIARKRYIQISQENILLFFS